MEEDNRATPVYSGLPAGYELCPICRNFTLYLDNDNTIKCLTCDYSESLERTSTAPISIRNLNPKTVSKEDVHLKCEVCGYYIPKIRPTFTPPPPNTQAEYTPNPADSDDDTEIFSLSEELDFPDH
jgi:hypothetical protein